METTGRPNPRLRARKKIKLTVVTAGQQMLSSVLVTGMTAVMVATNGMGVLPPNPISQQFVQVVSVSLPAEVAAPLNLAFGQAGLPDIPASPPLAGGEAGSQQEGEQELFLDSLFAVASGESLPGAADEPPAATLLDTLAAIVTGQPLPGSQEAPPTPTLLDSLAAIVTGQPLPDAQEEPSAPTLLDSLSALVTGQPLPGVEEEPPAPTMLDSLAALVTGQPLPGVAQEPPASTLLDTLLAFSSGTPIPTPTAPPAGLIDLLLGGIQPPPAVPIPPVATLTPTPTLLTGQPVAVTSTITVQPTQSSTATVAITSTPTGTLTPTVTGTATRLVVFVPPTLTRTPTFLPPTATHTSTPTAIPAPQFNISSVFLNGLGSAFFPVSVTPGASLSVTYNFQVFSDWCPGCIIQLVTGFGTAGSHGGACAYSGIPGAAPGVTSSESITLIAPSTPGTYDVVVEYHASYSCADALTAYGSQLPTNRRVIGQIVVAAPTPTPTATAIPAGYNISLVGIDGIYGSTMYYSPGASFTVTYNYSVWSFSNCPGCWFQLVTGLGSAGVGTSTCGYHGQPGYPGVSGSATIPMIAPLTQGVYLLNTEYQMQYTCANAIAAYSGSGANTGGEILVWPSADVINIWSAGFHDGNLGGRAGADALCVSTKPGGVTHPNVRALISTSPSDSIANMPSNYGVPTGKPIVYSSGYLVAKNWADMVDGSINTSFLQSGLAYNYWWSGTQTGNGISYPYTPTCLGFTSGAAGDTGNYGDGSRTDAGWANYGTITCNSMLTLMCIAYP